MKPQPSLPFVLILCAVHLVLALAFAAKTPYRQAGVVTINPSLEKDIGAPDERQHVNQMARLMRGDAYPVFQPGDPNLYENYQAHQPPLYYFLASKWAGLFGEGPRETLPEAGGPREITLPTAMGARSLNAVFGAANVAGVFFLGLWATRRRIVAITAAAFAALLPMNVALSGAASNDPLLFALCTWTLALTALSLREGWTWKRSVLIGVLVGAALLTKTSALALVPALLVAAFLRSPNRPPLAMVGATAAIALVMVAPWWARNQNLYGDPLAMGAFRQAFTGSAQKSTMTDTVIPRTNPGENPQIAYWTDWVGFWTARSFVGVFGYMDIWLTKSGRMAPSFDENRIYWVLLALIALGAVGSLVSLRQAELNEARPIRIVNATFFTIVLLLFIQFNLQYFQAQARYLLPALGPISCALAIGWLTLLKSRERVVPVAVAIVFGLTTVFAWIRLEPQFDLRIQAASTFSAPR